MFCDRCDRGWHLYCLNPPLQKPPRGEKGQRLLWVTFLLNEYDFHCSGDWICPTCKTLEAFVRQTNLTKARKLALGASARSPSISSPLASSYGAWEQGPNYGSVSLDQSSDEEEKPHYEGPMRASSPLAMHIDHSESPNILGKARQASRNGRGSRIRKPTDLDRSYEISSPKRSDSPNTRDTAFSSRATSQGQQSGSATEENLAFGLKGKDRGSTIVRLKLNNASRLGTKKPPNVAQQRNGRGGGTQSRAARPKSLALPSNGAVDDEYGDSDGSSSSRQEPTPRRLPADAENQGDDDDSDEEEIDRFKGVLTGPDADVSKAVPLDEDKERFERSKLAAEGRLGGAVASLPGSTSGRVIRKPLQTTFLTTPSTSSSAYFSASPWAGSGAGGEGSRLPRSSTKGQDSSTETSTPNTPGTPVAFEATVASSAESGTAMPIKMVRFGEFDIDTWYQAPYPEEYSRVPDGRLWICEYCLKYMKSRFMASRHRMKCKMRHPPGDEIYRDGNVSVFEVDGRKNKVSDSCSRTRLIEC